VHVSAILAAAGRGARFGASTPKQLQMLGGRPILQRSLDVFLRCDIVNDLVVALPADLASDPPAYICSANKALQIVAGGQQRQDSVARAFENIDTRAEFVVIHDAARPLVSDELIRRTVAAAAESGAAIAALRALDTVKRADRHGRITETLPRDEIYLAQTPQVFRVNVLRDALRLAVDATDEATLAERAGHRVTVVEGDPRNLKITTAEDLAFAERLLGGGTPASALRIGNGYDLHRLAAGRPLVLGGVTIPFEKGLLGHSDADAVCHAVTDAILGASGLGDIGRHFPDTEPAWKGANSIELLKKAAALVRARGYSVVNVDVTVIAQQPKLAPHVEAMRGHLAAALDCDASSVSVKGKTNEGVDAVGAGEAIAVYAVALLAG
jgi:2-C-methyl-D-erythritol 4-phosphate cytidylyltransferase/2-C-methyl-D-erythritol 2,4-cyclodiphosphate synthase